MATRQVMLPVHYSHYSIPLQLRLTGSTDHHNVYSLSGQNLSEYRRNLTSFV